MMVMRKVKVVVAAALLLALAAGSVQAQKLTKGDRAKLKKEAARARLHKVDAKKGRVTVAVTCGKLILTLELAVPKGAKIYDTAGAPLAKRLNDPLFKEKDRNVWIVLDDDAANTLKVLYFPRAVKKKAP
jgi:hypothetical protein